MSNKLKNQSDYSSFRDSVSVPLSLESRIVIPISYLNYSFSFFNSSLMFIPQLYISLKSFSSSPESKLRFSGSLCYVQNPLKRIFVSNSLGSFNNKSKISPSTSSSLIIISSPSFYSFNQSASYYFLISSSLI